MHGILDTQVQKLLRGMASRGAECCVIECPGFYLAQRHLQYVDFTLAIFTNLDDEQTENKFNDFQSYKAAKGRLFEVCYGFGGCWESSKQIVHTKLCRLLLS